VKNGAFKQDKDISLVCAIVFSRKNDNSNAENDLDNVVDEDV